MRIHLLLAFLMMGCMPFIHWCFESPPTDSWGPVVELRDDTQSWPDGKPVGGWWVTPIHATLLPSGNILITGWGRRDRMKCAQGGTRKHGTSFLVDPDTLIGSRLNIQPLDEQGMPESDALYCAGHSPLPDGRILFAGGSRYKNLGMPTEVERGINYGRLFNTSDGTFSRIPIPMAGGPLAIKACDGTPLLPVCQIHELWSLVDSQNVAVGISAT